MHKKILSLIFVFCIIFSLFSVSIYAAEGEESTSTPSDVLDDLKRDASFYASDYPVSSTNYSFEVIQIAESDKKELFIYTYNPSYQSIGMIAADIVMWDTPSLTDFTPVMCTLTLVSEFEQFQKYRVEGYTVPSERVRYYNISQVHVPYDETAHSDRDMELLSDRKVAYKVGQYWEVMEINDTINYSRADLDVVELDILHSGEIFLDNGFVFGQSLDYKDQYMHYVVFDCDAYKIEHIVDADLSFYTRTVTVKTDYTSDPNEITITEDDDIELHSFTLDDAQMNVFDGEGWFGDKVEWHRIMKSSDFKESMVEQGIVFDDVVLAKLDSANGWVFAFYESDRHYDSVKISAGHGPSVLKSSTEVKTKVFDLGILRIQFFDIHGERYNLGVVADLVTSDGISDGSTKFNFEFDTSAFDEMIKTIMTIIGIVLIVIVIGFCMPILSPIISLIVKAIGFALKLIISVITFPFKLIFRRR